MNYSTASVKFESNKIKTNLLQYCDEFDAIRRLRILDKSKNIKNVIIRNYYDIFNVSMRSSYQYIIDPVLYKKNVHILDLIIVPKDENKRVHFKVWFDGLNSNKILNDHAIKMCPFKNLPLSLPLNLNKNEEELVKSLCTFYIDYTKYRTESFLYGNLFEIHKV